ncbi:4-hydroxy-tetrahydrodipicolinate reductase [Acholeplasma equirhinis]|uniref:4-hydroxy-tetrahydrodipicolinate reductase n=1 Tax=Acholeplasma equirhinis TaxID=555393 RepID=UPI00197A8E24|nr:4-hydroxy-tetrahydrodipicolinate reductase [Acholeplasma equirhinis]MBN3490446.1 4-hydroxy-tetrahydrodipicolinate reductase [Acholeplasma equirhinis]
MVKIIISGILGKMGQNVYEAVMADETLEFVGGLDLQETKISKSSIQELEKADVLVDFSHPSNLDQILKYAKQTKLALVLATTGYSKSDYKKIVEASLEIPIFYSTNYSVGVYLVNQALKMIASKIDDNYDIELVEKHHRFKKDAPSGTALTMAENISKNLSYETPIIHGDSSEKGIHMHALRLGNYVGEHEVIFSNLSETIEIKHIAHDKRVFAIGALKAAKFIQNKEKGLFGMDDLLGDI